MKNIIIVTFQRADNYGAALQAFALQHYLKLKKYNVKTLDYRDANIERGYKVINIYKSGKKIFIKSVIKNILFFNRNLKRKRSFAKFRKKYIELTNEYVSLDKLKDNPPKADIYIAGSDQVWNTKITFGLQDVYTLNFGNDNVNRISYAASIGNSLIYDYEKDFFINKIKKIDNISVREEKAKELLNGIGIDNVKVNIDPTLLIKQEQWNKMIENVKVPKQKYLLAYVVEKNDEYYKISNYVANKCNEKIVYFEMFNKYYKEKTINKYSSDPLEFVALIKNADKVICTSFHATVFSIIFHKNFYVVPHARTGNRVTNLLSQLCLDDRIVYTYDDFIRMEKNKNEIDWGKVDKKLEELREDSGKWLIDTIESRD